MISRTAVISDDGLYRYKLTRTWDAATEHRLFVMLNPSTADADIDDPTIRRCMGFARRDGFGGIVVLNLYAFRATDPKQLKSAIDPVGPENDETLRRELVFAWRNGHKPIAAWGANAELERVEDVRDLSFVDWYALGLTKSGQPRHPLYLPGDAPLIEWRHS